MRPGNFFWRYAAESGRASSTRSICSAGSSPAAIQEKLPRRIAPGVGERVQLRLADFARQRQHAAQHFAQRRAIVVRRSNAPSASSSRSSTGSSSISRSTSRTRAAGFVVVQRRTTPVSLRAPNGTSTRQPA